MFRLWISLFELDECNYIICGGCGYCYPIFNTLFIFNFHSFFRLCTCINLSETYSSIHPSNVQNITIQWLNSHIYTLLISSVVATCLYKIEQFTSEGGDESWSSRRGSNSSWITGANRAVSVADWTWLLHPGNCDRAYKTSVAPGRMRLKMSLELRRYTRWWR